MEKSCLTILKQLSTTFARLKDRYNFNYQTLFSATFAKQDEVDHVINEFHLQKMMKINQVLTQSDIDNFDIGSQLERQIANQEMNDSDWRPDKSISITIYFSETGERNASGCIKFPKRSLGILNEDN